MKHQIILFVLAVLFVNVGFTQVKHVKGVHFLDINYQRSFEGQGFEAGYGYFISKKFFMDAKFSKEKGKVDFTDFDIIGAKLQPYYAIVSPFKGYYISTYLNLGLYKESISCVPLNQSLSKGVWHVGAGLLQEYYFSSFAGVNVFVEQNLTGNSILGKSYFMYGAGLKVILNNITRSKQN